MCCYIEDVFIQKKKLKKNHQVKPELQQFEQKVVASVGHDVLGPPAMLETPCLPSVETLTDVSTCWGTHVVVMISSLVLLISRTGP